MPFVRGLEASFVVKHGLGNAIDFRRVAISNTSYCKSNKQKGVEDRENATCYVPFLS